MVADLLVQASPVESYQRTGTAQRQGDLIRIGDFADLDLGYRDPPLTLMRYDGQPAIALAITNQPGVNVVELGRASMPAWPTARLPDRHRGPSRALAVGADRCAVRGFFVSLAQAVLIVMAVLAMGWRMGVIIGSSIILTILGTFVVMAGLGIDLQRMSLGALIGARDDGRQLDRRRRGAMVRMQQGMDRVKAASRRRRSRLGRCWAPRSSPCSPSIRSRPRARTPASIAPRCSRSRRSRCC